MGASLTSVPLAHLPSSSRPLQSTSISTPLPGLPQQQQHQHQHQHAPPPADTPASTASASIHSLPSELLRLILELGASSFPEGPGLEFYEPYHFLCMASLSSRELYQEAQPILYQKIYLKYESSAQSLLRDSKFESHQTRFLMMRGNDGSLHRVMGSTAMEVLGRVRGLRELELSGIPRNDRLDFNCLSSANLAELDSLTFSPDYFFLEESNRSDPPVPSFALRRIVLQSSFYHSFRVPPNKASYPPFYSPSITHLEFTYIPDDPTFLPFFESLAPQLVDLRVKVIDISVHTSLASLKKLHHLSINCKYPALEAVLSLLGGKLTSLSLGHETFVHGPVDPPTGMERLLELPALEELKLLVLDSDFISYDENARSKMRSRAEPRGIVVEFTKFEY